MKKFISALLMLCACLFTGIMFSACSYFDFASTNTVATWHTGSGEPSRTITAQVNDLYVDTDTGDVYQLDYQGWSYVTTIDKDNMAIDNIVIDENGNLVITYKDKTEEKLELLKACTCWNNAGEVVTEDDLYSNEHYTVECIKEHTSEAKGLYSVECTKCEWEVLYTGSLHTKKTILNDCLKSDYKLEVCSDCLKWINTTSDYVEHTYKTTPDSTTKPTCTEDGYKIYKCTVCDKEKKEAADKALGHETEVQYATEKGETFCVDGGYKITYCTRKGCDWLNQEEFTDGPGHNILLNAVPDSSDDRLEGKELKLTTAPTEEAKGLLTGYCTLCCQTIEIEMPKLDKHKYDYIYDCSISDKVYYATYVNGHGELLTEEPDEDEEYITYTFDCADILYHTLNRELMMENRYPVTMKGIHEFINSQAPSCAEDGIGYYTCDKCERKIAVTTYIEHTVKMEDVVASIEPTCLKTGEGSGNCSECGELVDNIVIPKTGHKYHNEFSIEYNPTNKKWTISIEVTCTNENCDGTCTFKNNCDKEICNNKYHDSIKNVKVLESYEETLSDGTVVTHKTEAPTCLSKGLVICEYKDKYGETKVDILVADELNFNPGHEKYTTDCSWTWEKDWTDPDNNRTYKNCTYEYEGFICNICEVRFITKIVVKDRNGAVLQELSFPKENALVDTTYTGA